MAKAMTAWVGAREAARLLGVTRATLYAYVSRGFVRSQAGAASTRERTYAREDLERLRQRSEERREPDKAAARALHWGMPILESSIALIDGRALHYRGQNAADLARSRTLEEVASLIWTGTFAQTPPATVQKMSALPLPRGPFVARAQALLAATAASDATAFDVRPQAVVRKGWVILRALTAAAAGTRPADAGVHTVLANAWKVSGGGAELLRAALVLCADHELNVSSFTARAVASAGAHPYGVVIAGLAALEGPRHGGAGARVDAMLTSMRQARRLPQALSERLRRGDAIEGFGHPLYRDGDPRAALLLDLLGREWGDRAEYRFVRAFANAAGEVTGDRPNVDFALAALARVLRLPPDAPLAIFALGRSVGWIGHAIEQYETGQLIRPRAKYVGPLPRVG